MKSIQAHIKNHTQINDAISKLESISANLILAFGSVSFFTDNSIKSIAEKFPNAAFIGCSTAGEISNDGVTDDTLVLSGCHFNHPNFEMVSQSVVNMSNTREAGKAMASKLKKDSLSSIFLLGRGLDINGSALIEGIRDILGNEVPITGGLAGDGGKFQQTFTANGTEISDNSVVALAVYGNNIKVAFGSMGGWEPFGPVRRITRAKDNVLFELDNKPALEIYRSYLGDKARDLPSSGLLYPFAILKDNQSTTGIIRTILAINEKEQSLTLAGDMPANGLVRLMHSNNEGLVKGARDAAEATLKRLTNSDKTGLGVLISCVGRKLVMGTDIEDELDAVRESLGDVMLTGFYSYGEICPQEGFAECKLHNQTMTISYFYEV